MPKKTGKRRSHPANAKRGNGRARTGPAPGDAQGARAFDLIVRDLPTKPMSTGRANARRARAEVSGMGEASAMIQQLYTARQLAEDTRNEIEKRITELRRQMRRSAA